MSEPRYHTFAPKRAGSRWCLICDDKDTAPQHYPPRTEDTTR